MGFGQAFSSTWDFQASSHPTAGQPALGTIPSAPEVNDPKALLLLCSFHWEGSELLWVWKSEALNFLGLSCFYKTVSLSQAS